MTVRGNLVPDAHIAAILLSHGVKEIVTNDSDFHRFQYLTHSQSFSSPSALRSCYKIPQVSASQGKNHQLLERCLNITRHDAKVTR